MENIKVTYNEETKKVRFEKSTVLIEEDTVDEMREQIGKWDAEIEDTIFRMTAELKDKRDKLQAKLDLAIQQVPAVADAVAEAVRIEAETKKP